jgi:small subunit ribosomal protein S17
MPKRILQGTVVSTKNDKTLSVKVERTFRHPLYKKTVRKSTKYAAHDNRNQYKVGDKVRIQECRPISKTKTWVVIDQY